MILAPNYEPLVPAKAGAQVCEQQHFCIPAFAGMSGGEAS